MPDILGNHRVRIYRRRRGTRGNRVHPHVILSMGVTRSRTLAVARRWWRITSGGQWIPWSGVRLYKVPLRRLVIEEALGGGWSTWTPRNRFRPSLLRAPTPIGGVIVPTIVTHNAGLHPTLSRAKGVIPSTCGTRYPLCLRWITPRWFRRCRPAMWWDIRTWIRWDWTKSGTMTILPAIRAPNVRGVYPGLTWRWWCIYALSIDGHGQLVP